MDVQEFFDLSTGKWFSQRTSHDLETKHSENAKSDLTFDILPHQDPAITALCQQHNIDPSLAWGGAKTAWKGSMYRNKEREQNNYTGTSIIVAVPNPDAPGSGLLLKSAGSAASYHIGDDGAITFTTGDDRIYAQERIWFASPNLRLRTSILKQIDRGNISSFSSEIRMGGAKPN
jgi:hypothetical protein